jgi:hypothetical protein
MAKKKGGFSAFFFAWNFVVLEVGCNPGPDDLLFYA